MGLAFNLVNHFLIAMPGMTDPNFQQTVIYVCEHNEHGAIGIVINRPLSGVSLKDVFKQIGIESTNPDADDIPVLFGGPVQQERGFVIHPPPAQWRSSLVASETLVITTSQDVLVAIANNQGPKPVLIALGYASWTPKQFEQEMLNNAWLHCPVDPDILFHQPYHLRWQKAAHSLGIDMTRLMGDAGHA